MVEQEDFKEPGSPKEISEVEVEQWFESEEEESVEQVASNRDVAQKASANQLRIVRSSMDLTLHSLRRSMRESSYIDMHPGYQRRHRWDTKKRSRLIESLLLNIPIPPIFLFESDLNRYEVMDGSQRLEAITGYLDNGYKLSGLEFLTELNGNSFEEITPTTQRSLFSRVGAAKIWERLGQQSQVQLHFEENNADRATKEARAKLNEFMDLRNKVAHPSGEMTWPGIGDAKEYIDFCEVLGSAIDGICRVWTTKLGKDTA